MHNNVVYHTARALRESGFNVLRFNFRGVGRSAGVYDHGRGEQDDARAALDLLRQRFTGDALWMAGFSFGSWVGSKVAMTSTDVQAMLALGMPVASADFSHVADYALPLAVVQGAHDSYGSAEAVRESLGRLGRRAHLEVIDGADHFFHGMLDELRAAVTRAVQWIEEGSWRSEPGAGG